MAKILVVEDDQVINQVVVEFLKEQDHKVISVFDGKAALEAFHGESFDLIILDIMIPHISGLEVLKEIRLSSDVPVMMLTAMSDEYTQLISFNHLISDYVVKPFSPLILMKRVENILRHTDQISELKIADICIQEEAGSVTDHGEEVKLTKKEYDVLLYLAKHSGQIVSRDQLMLGIWGYTELDSRVLDNHIKNLRRKLPNLPLKTLIGRGYQLEED